MVWWHKNSTRQHELNTSEVAALPSPNSSAFVLVRTFLSNAGRGAYTTKPRVRRPAGSGTSPLALADAAQETGPKHEVEHTNPSCYWHLQYDVTSGIAHARQRK